MIPSILVVAREPIPLVRQLGEAIQNMAHIHAAKSGMEGLSAFRKRQPLIVIVDNDLPDLLGESLASIIKDTEAGKEAVVYLMNVTTLLQNTKADHYISAPVNAEVFVEQLKQDLEKLLLLTARSDEIERAIAIQRGMLPPPIRNEKFEINFIYSPYNDLSGDGLCYWYPAPTEEKDALYGFLFDCTGHDLSSYGQAGSLWQSLRHGLDFLQKGVYEDLAQVMKSINDEIMEYYNSDEPNMSAAIVFCLDFMGGALRYCSAGNPEILVRRREMEVIKLRTSPLGYLESTVYRECSLPLAGVREIVFASDGLSELLLANQDPGTTRTAAKHDDVSAVFIKLKGKDVQSGHRTMKGDIPVEIRNH